MARRVGLKCMSKHDKLGKVEDQLRGIEDFIEQLLALSAGESGLGKLLPKSPNEFKNFLSLLVDVQRLRLNLLGVSPDAGEDLTDKLRKLLGVDDIESGEDNSVDGEDDSEEGESDKLVRVSEKVDS